MKKLENLQKYINACEDNMSIAEKEQEKFIEEVLSVFGNEIDGITNHLDMYAYHLEGEIYDYNGDIKKIKSILINYKDNLEMEIEKRKNELELARLKQGSINVSANANNANSINISLTLEQALENIRKISDDILCKEEKEEIEDKLCGISEAVKRDKGKAKDKIVAVLKFVADKGADALVAILPYLGQMAGIL